MKFRFVSNYVNSLPELRQSFQLLSLLALLFISGCSSTNTPSVSFEPHLYDHHFPEFQDVDIVQEEQIFWLNEKSKTYVRERVDLAKSTDDIALTLIADLFSPSQLAIDYVYGANTVAQDTFDSGAANCLSLTILAYSMAQEAGLNVVFQEVLQEESWNQMGEFELANGHVNLLISRKHRYSQTPYIPQLKRTYTVDFFPESRGQRARSREISKTSITSFFYSNAGASELVKGNLDAAYANFRKALQLNSADSSAWSNLGIVLTRQQQYEAAGSVYDIALELNPENYTAWDNLVALNLRLGNHDRVKEIKRMLADVRSDNPNYYLRNGNRYLNNGELDEAESAYRKSLKLAPRNHYAWHAIAKVRSMKGDLEGTMSALEKARKYANQGSFERRYGQKLVALASYKQ